LQVETLEPRLALTAALGDQFTVAEAFDFESGRPAVVVHQDGSFTTAWETYGEDGSGYGVFAQRYNANGTSSVVTPNPIQVNTQGLGEQSGPDLAGDATGRVLVVWQSSSPTSDAFDIYGQWYDANVGAVGGEFRINTTTTAGDQRAPAVAMDSSGRAIVAWQSEGQDGDDWGVYYTRIDFGDTTPDAEIRVNDAILGAQQRPTVAASADGKFVIAWEAIDPAGGSDASLDIYAKAYQPNGTQLGGEFKVNTVDLRDQITPEVTVASDGSFVVVWVGTGIPGSGSDIFAQRFDSLTGAQGLEFRVNDTTLASQVSADVAADPDGNFLVTWQSVHQDGFSEGIFGRSYSNSGATLVPEFQVNTRAEDPQTSPAVAINALGQTVVIWRGRTDDHKPVLCAQRYLMPNTDGSFVVGTETELASFSELEGNGASAAMDIAGRTVVVWESYGEDGDGLGVYAQLVDAAGELDGGPILVHPTFTAGDQAAPAVAKAADGRFVVVWQSQDQDGSGNGIFAQRYSATGVPEGGLIDVNTTTLGDQSQPAVAMGEDGRFVVVWQGDAGDGTTNIYAQRFDAAGNPVGLEFQVNQFTALDQTTPTVAMNAVGEFAIAWVSSHPAATIPEIDPEKSVFFQWYNASGLAVGAEVLAHQYVKDAQEYPAIGIDAAGNLVLAWQSINQDGSTWGVYARQFLANKTPVQAEEFLVNQTTEGLQRLVGLGVQADGRFVVAWESTSTDQLDGISTDIYRREYLADGSPDSGELLVNTWTGGPQIQPVVARAPTGNYGIFWGGQGFSHVDGVHGRLYDINLTDDPGTPSRVPLGDQFLVAETLGFENSTPGIAVHGDGGFTIAFETFEEDGSGFGIFVERFDSQGTSIANSRIPTNTTVDDDQSAPAIASDADGNVLVVWQSANQDGDGLGVYGQWFAANGTAMGNEFRLSQATVGDQKSPSVAMDGDGRAIVAWQSESQTGDGWDIYYVLLSQFDDTPAAEQRAHVVALGDQEAPSVAANDSGEFVIAWHGPGESTEESEATIDVFARRFNPDGTPQGAEITINNTLEHDQILPSAAMDADGNVVIVWQAEGQQGSGSDVYLRRWDAGSSPSGVDVLVNETPQGPQRSPSVSIHPDGNTLVVWQSQHQDGFSWGIFGREFDSSGSAIVSEFQINTRVQGPQTSPNVAMNADGDAVVVWLGNTATHLPGVFAQLYQVSTTDPVVSVGGELVLTNFQGIEETPPAAAMNAFGEAVVAWESYAEDGSGLGVFAQMLDAQGNPIGPRFAVNPITDGNQGAPAVARTASGQFIIVWQSENADGTSSIWARRYSATGVPNGAAFEVNTASGIHATPTVAMAPDGRFVIVWESVSGDGSLDIRARRFHADGSADGGEFTVNQFTGLDQKSAAVAMNYLGEFVIVWVSDHPALTDPNDTEKSIFAQWFDSNGNTQGPEVLVHRYVKDGQEDPAVGIDDQGRFVVAWQSINQDGNTWGVFARRFNADKSPIENREFTVNETRQGPQRYVGLGVDRTGRFVVTWQSNSHTQEGSSWDVFSRQYSADGSPEGSELPVNQWTQGPQIRPVVAQAPGGDFGIFWLGQGPDHIEGVHGRLYQALRLETVIVVGPAAGGDTVLVLDPLTQAQLAKLTPFPGFAGGVRVAMGDITGDGVDDIIAGAGAGGGPHVRVFDGRTFQQIDGPLGSFFAYDAGFTGGVWVAAGDVDHDGYADLITGAGAGGGPHVRVFSGFDGSQLASFFAYDPAFTGGVHVAAGDVDHDGYADVITGAGAGGGPHVRVFSGGNQSELASFFAYDPAFTGGVHVAAGDVDHDGHADIITGAGPGGGPHVRVISGNDQSELASFFAYDAAFTGGTTVGSGYPGPSGSRHSGSVIVVGPASGGDTVLVLDPLTRAQLATLTPFPGFTGGVRVAMGDVNGDKVDDIIIAAGPGGGPHVRVFDGVTFRQIGGPLGSFFAYDAGFTGGVWVAAGDVNYDGYADVITGAGAGGGPHVRVFSGFDGAELASFFAYDPAFTGGVHVAAGDVDHDGHADVITGAGVGGSPHVRVFSGADQSELASFFAYDSAFSGGVSVAAGDVDHDGHADIITGAGPGGGPHVRVFSGADQSELASFFAYDPAFTGGIYVGAEDIDHNGHADIITGPGLGGSPEVRVFSGDDQTELAGVLVFDAASTGGVTVAGGFRGHSLMAQNEMFNGSPTLLTQAVLDTAVDEAILAWTTSGISGTAMAKLAAARVTIANLPGATLGLAAGDRVWIDADAAGHGWARSIEELADRGQLDLFTAVAHELGHIIGLVDLNPNADGLMAADLAPGVRKLPRE
jgi:hypothetical protein